MSNLDQLDTGGRTSKMIGDSVREGANSYLKSTQLGKKTKTKTGKKKYKNKTKRGKKK